MRVRRGPQCVGIETPLIIAAAPIARRTTYGSTSEAVAKPSSLVGVASATIPLRAPETLRTRSFCQATEQDEDH